MISYNATGTTTPIASPTRALKWRCCSSFSISASAARSPAISFTTGGKVHPKVPLEAAYHKADDAIQEIIHLLKAA
jgi:hypothetical protein